jgi:hypothetical protein
MIRRNDYIYFNIFIYSRIFYIGGMFQKNQIDDDSDLDVKAVDKTDEKSI